MSNQWQMVSDTEDMTRKLGWCLGKTAKPYSVLLLTGDLGAGKTSLTKGLALGLDCPDTVTSPTFTLMQEYLGRLPLVHMDAYRLADGEEALAAGLEEALLSDSVVVVEWAEIIGSIWPTDVLSLAITIGEGQKRQMNFKSQGPISDAWLTGLQVCWEGKNR